MRNSSFLLFATTIQFAFALQLVGATVQSSITAVTVYSDRAIVSRTATADLLAGEQTLAFENLPSALVDQSLQAFGHGLSGATILDVSARNVFEEATPNERVKAIEEQIKVLQKQRRILDDRAKGLLEQYGFVQRMLQASTSTSLGGGVDHVGATRPSLEEWQKLYTYADETFGKIATEQQSIDNQREELQAKQAVLDGQLSELRGARSRISKTVAVRLAAATPGRLELTIRYSVPNAGWSPSYDARLRSDDRAIELSYFGVVRNGTGEDWNEVNLTLSTARPNLGGGAPELRPWFADVTQPVAVAATPTPGSRRGGAGESAVRFSNGAMAFNSAQIFNSTQGFNNDAMGGNRSGGAAPLTAAENDAAMLSAAVEAGITSATFKIPVRVSVPGNSVSQRVSISAHKLAATLQYQSTPKVLEAAFLSAYANNTTEYPLLAGPMNTFLDDTYVAASNLKTVMPGERFELALGADDAITVKRRVVGRFAEDTGMTGKYRRVTYEFLITITNNKKTPERVVFKEVTPVSRDEKIVTKLLAPAEREVGTLASLQSKEIKDVTREEDGKLVWRVNLKPGERREFPVKFTVEHPADLTVTGLD